MQPVPPQSTSLPAFLEMQQTLGNQAVQRLYRAGVLQAKLKIGAPGDKYEQEADRVADQVMRMPEPIVRRQATEEEEPVQARRLAAQITPFVQRQPAGEEEGQVRAKFESGGEAQIQRQAWLIAHRPFVQRAVPVAVREEDDKKKVQTKPLLQRQEEKEDEAQTFSLQRQKEEDESAQAKFVSTAGPQLQRQEEKEDESAQTKSLLQRQEKKEEEKKPTQAKSVNGLVATLQRQEEKEDEAQTFSLQRQKEEDESAQAKPASTVGPHLQRQQEKEDEAAQTKSLPQRQKEKEEEKTAQAKFAAGLSYALQRQEEKEDESAQAMKVQRRQFHISPPALQAKPGGSGEMHASSAVEARVSHSRGGGSELPNDTRAFMESRFGVDFSQVRVHTGTDAAQMSQELNAQAFTVGRDIYFGNGKYNPQTSSGQQLLAHELTHVVQQGAALRAKPITVTPAPQKIQRSPGPIANLLNKVARNIPGYTLITVIIGKNPITGEEVPRTAKNFLGGFMGLIPGGTALFDNLNKSGAIDEAFNWLQKEVQALNITWAGIKALIAEAWDKVSIWFGIEKNLKIIKDVFAPTVTRVFNFVKSLGSKILEFIFTGVLKMIGAPVNQIMAILNKGKEVITKIIKDPIGFVKNLIKGLIQGIGQFAKNALKHLKAGISGWLFGALSAANITLPSKFDLKGIFHLVLQILGATYQAIRAKVVKALGPKGESIVSKVEKAVEFVKELVTKGPIALWERVKDSLSNLKETVFGAIIDWVKSTIIGKAIEKLISFFNPAGALIQAVIAIYNTVKFFIERINQIREFAASVFNSIAEIASGNLGKAANAVENAIAKSIPVIISFLASLIGLGGISKKIQEIIKKIRQPIDKAIGKVVGWIVEKAKSLFGKIRGKFQKKLSPEQSRKVALGLAAIDEEEKKYLKDGKISQDDARKVAGKIRSLHPVFKSIDVVDGGESWDYRYTVNPTTTKKGEKKATSEKRYAVGLHPVKPPAGLEKSPGESHHVPPRVLLRLSSFARTLVGDALLNRKSSVAKAYGAYLMKEAMKDLQKYSHGNQLSAIWLTTADHDKAHKPLDEPDADPLIKTNSPRLKTLVRLVINLPDQDEQGKDESLLSIVNRMYDIFEQVYRRLLKNGIAAVKRIKHNGKPVVDGGAVAELEKNAETSWRPWREP